MDKHAVPAVFYRVQTWKRQELCKRPDFIHTLASGIRECESWGQAGEHQSTVVLGKISVFPDHFSGLVDVGALWHRAAVHKVLWTIAENRNKGL